MTDVGDLSVKLGLDSSQLDAGAKRAIGSLKGVGDAAKQAKPKLDLDVSQFDQGLKQAVASLQNLTKQRPKLQIFADTQQAKAMVSQLEGNLSKLNRAKYTAVALADTDQAQRELLELQALLLRLDDRPAHVQVRADVTSALADLQTLRREMGLVESDTVVVSTRMAGMSGTLAGIGKQAVAMGAGFGIAQVGMNLLGSAGSFLVDSFFGMNVEMENVKAQLMAFTKDGDAAAQILKQIQDEAANTPFGFNEMAKAVASIYPLAKQSGEELMGLVKTAEILAASNPLEGLEGAAFALREALSGDFQSLIERFNIPRYAINQLKEEGLPNIEIVRQAMQGLGLDTSLVGNLAQTTSGKWSTFLDNVRNAAARLGEPFVRLANEGIGHLIEVTESANFEETIDGWTRSMENFATTATTFWQDNGSTIIALAEGTAGAVQRIAENLLKIADVAIKVADAVNQGNNPGGQQTPYGEMPQPSGSGSNSYTPFGKKFDDVTSYGVTDAGKDLYNFLVKTADQADKTGDEVADYTGKLNDLTDQQLRTIHAAANWSGDLTDEQEHIKRVAQAYERALPPQQGYLNHLKRMDETLPPISADIAEMTASQLQGLGPAEEHAKALAKINESAELTDGGMRQLAATQDAAFNNLRNANMDAELYASTLTTQEQAAMAASEAMARLQIAQDGLTRSQGELTNVMGAFSAQGSEYASTQKALEEGYKIVQEKQVAGISLSEDEQKLLTEYPELYGRISGAQKDSAEQEGMVAAAKISVMQAQDELNDAIARGDTNLGPYQDKLGDAQDFLSDVDPASGAQQAFENLGKVIGTDLIDKLNELILKIDELGEKKAEPTIDLDGSAFDQNIGAARQGLTEFDGTVAVAKADLDTTAFYAVYNALPREFTVKGYVQFQGNTQVGLTAGNNAAGGVIDRPMLSMVGEEAPAHPEFIIPTNPSRRDRALGLWSQAGHELGVPGFADGGGPAASGSGPGDSGASIEVSVNVVEPNWDIIFAGLDPAADDATKQAADRFSSLFSDIEALASGDAMRTAQQDLRDLFTLKEIAIQTGAGEQAVAGLDAEIAAQQAKVEAIGAAMGTTIVTAIAGEIASGDYLSQLIDNVSGLNVDDLADPQFLEDLQHTIDDLHTLREAAIQAGMPPEVVAAIEQQITDATAKFKTASEIAGTEIVQGIADGIEQEAQNQQIADSILGLASADNPYQQVADLTERVTQLRAAIAAAQAAGNTAAAEILQSQLDQVTANFTQTKTDLTTMLTEGLISEDQLKDMAEQGGEAFEAYYDSLFGEGALEKVEDGWNDLNAIAIDQLESVLPQLKDGGLSMVETLIEQVGRGERDWDDAWGALAAIAESGMVQIGDDVVTGSDAMIYTLEQLGAAFEQQLAEAMANGTDPAPILANIATIKAALEALGVDVSNINFDVEVDTTVAAHTTPPDTGGGHISGQHTHDTGYGQDIPAASDPTTNEPPSASERVARSVALWEQWVAEVVGFGTGFDDEGHLSMSLDSLAAAVEQAAHRMDVLDDPLTDLNESVSGLDLTFADELTSLADLVSTLPDIQSSTNQEILGLLHGELTDLGLDSAEALGEALLEANGFTVEQLKAMGLSDEAITDIENSLASDPTVDAIHSQIDAVNAGTAQIVAAVQGLSASVSTTLNVTGAFSTASTAATSVEPNHVVISRSGASRSAQAAPDAYYTAVRDGIAGGFQRVMSGQATSPSLVGGV